MPAVRRPRTLLAGVLCVLGLLAAAPARAALPPVRHVFIVMLENETYASTFGANTKIPYLARTLAAQGALVPNYFGIGHASLDNYIALVSGQGPNPITQADCPVFMDVLPGVIAADQQALGLGCVYSASVPTIADQLDAQHLTWRGYMEDMGNSTTQDRTCRHPPLLAPDDTQSARAGDQYAARHNPFVYFHSLIDSPGCAANDVPLDRLYSDLRSASATPNYAFISPNLCNDGHDAPCVDGRPGGLRSANTFLEALVPQILASPAFQSDGLLIVTFDESGGGSQACCGERAPGTLSAGGVSPGPGGGQVGAVMLSPYIAPGTRDQTPYNHYSLLRSVEDIFGLAHLGYAADAGLSTFGANIFTARAAGSPGLAARAPGCRARSLPARARGRLSRGSLIAGARVGAVPGGGRRLVVALAHRARIAASVVAGGRTRRLASRFGLACRSYRLVLPAGHGRVRLSASVGRGREARSLRY